MTTTTETPPRSDPWFFPALALTFLIGATLRLYLLSSQILLDDEWHGIRFIIGKSFIEVLTSFDPVDNSSAPLNLYRYFLGHILGWSELGLRLPSVIAGLVGLALLPLVIRRILNDRVALIFALLLAISPVTIFYSRFSRAYGIVMPLCFWAVLSLSQWFKDGERRHAVCFAIAAGFSAYFHLSSVVTIFTPVGIVLILGFLKQQAGSSSSTALVKPGLKERFILFSALLAMVFILDMPAILNSSELPLERDSFTLSGLGIAASLTSGTANVPLTILFFVFFCTGARLLLREKHNMGWMALCILAAHLLALLILRPDGLNVGLVLLRYMIVIIPIALLMVAVAVERLVSILESKVPAMPMSVATLPFSAFALAALLFLAGPLPQTYSAPNDFTNHTAFQGSYERLGWETSDSRTVFTDFKVRKNEIPSFYHRLKDQKDVQVILEYPFDVCNHNNLHYFYQHFHGKRVIAGYNRRMDQLGWILQPDERPSPQKRMIVSECSLDRILFRAEDPGLLAFQNLIDINDSKALVESGAEILVLRKSLMALCVMDGREASIRVYYRCMAAQKKRLTEIFGDPVYEDAEIVCFRIRSRF